MTDSQAPASLVFVTPTVTTLPSDDVTGDATATVGGTVVTLAPAIQPGDAKTVELVGVGLSADSNMVVVAFRTDPVIARRWMEGNVYVVDEATGVVYGSIPVMPIIGPLFTRPAHKGQVGNVMFNNTQMGLRKGSRVTVVLGGFKKEHLTLP